MTNLRIGLILPDETIPAWAARLLEKTRAWPEVEVVSVLIIPQEKNTSSLFRAYFNLDRRTFHPKPSPWEAQPLPADLHLLRGEYTAQLQALRLDILLNMSLEEFPAELPSLARLGVWTVRDGQSRLGDQPRGAPGNAACADPVAIAEGRTRRHPTWL